MTTELILSVYGNSLHVFIDSSKHKYIVSTPHHVGVHIHPQVLFVDLFLQIKYLQNVGFRYYEEVR